MATLLSILPDLASELETALLTEGRVELVAQLTSVNVQRCTYDPEADAGYIYLIRRPPSIHFAKLAAPVAETIPFFDENGFNVDIDHDGQLFGIELLGRPDLINKLKEKNML